MKWEQVNHNCYVLDLGDGKKITAKYNLDVGNGVGPLDNTFFSLNLYRDNHETVHIIYYPFKNPHLRTHLIIESMESNLFLRDTLVNLKTDGLPEVFGNQLEIMFLLHDNLHYIHV